jgi:hypothetical protein
MPVAKKTRVHSVKANLQVVELTKAGSSLDLEIFNDEGKLGTIIIGRGSLYWIGANKQKSNRISWSKFANMMNKLAYGNED